MNIEPTEGDAIDILEPTIADWEENDLPPPPPEALKLPPLKPKLPPPPPPLLVLTVLVMLTLEEVMTGLFPLKGKIQREKGGAER